MKENLREGFTTGSAAAAAAKAGTAFLLGEGENKNVDIPLPGKRRLKIPVSAYQPLEPNKVRVTVTKDAGDDPDVTNRAEIECFVELFQDKRDGKIVLIGGEGVGIVTLPGLAVAVGEAAINPGPRKQIQEAVQEALAEAGSSAAVTVTVQVPRGRDLARKTMNPRLGIEGGISILGTRGTVRPFSHEAYAASISLALDVAKAQGAKVAALSTGRATESFLRKDFPDLTDRAFVPIADYFAFSLEQAAKKGFKDIIVGCFFGKLVKMAQGAGYTHAKQSVIDFDTLADWCLSAGLTEEKIRAVRGANTARQALEIILKEPDPDPVLCAVTKKALESAQGFAGSGPRIEYHVYGFDGAALCRVQGGN
ncbi:MAG: cobalt-precorrin-5B (C(1))-methyltransferase CbiD [Thermodesulfobacteriota bacterium]|nr:cobalt-precorrin-5B (C(1))-methyltransferase CbiD [Thermodesulfobacteriota bacterium]